MAVSPEALSRARANVAGAARAAVEAATTNRQQVETARSGKFGLVRRVLPKNREAHLTTLTRQEEQARRHAELVQEVVDGDYRYTVEPHTRRGAWHNSKEWTIVGTNSRGESDVLSTSTEQVDQGPNMGIRQRAPMYEQVYYGSHGDTQYTSDEAEARGKAIHSVLFPIYQAAERENN